MTAPDQPSASPGGRRKRPLLALAVAAMIGVSLMPRGSSATVEEQRARLPPPAECPDRVEGTWLAMVYMGYQRTWYEYTLQIKRSAPADAKGNGPIEGEMISHFWYGGIKEDKPPPCGIGRRELTVKMPAKGTFDEAGNVAFNSSTYTIDNIVCGRAGLYNPDNFTGRIDPKLQEFQSVNNDGGGAVNEPAVFRRIRCLNASEAPSRKSTQAKPPAFSPPKKWSCGK